MYCLTIFVLFFIFEICAVQQPAWAWAWQRIVNISPNGTTIGVSLFITFLKIYFSGAGFQYFSLENM